MSHYEALGVGKDADEEEIKRAYRNKRSASHPDKGGTPEKFHPIQKAYEVLSDAKSRARYDRGEPDRPDDPRGEALQEIAKLFMSAVDELDVEHDDLIHAVRHAVTQAKGEVQKARRDVEKGMAKRRKALKRLGRRKDAKGDDVVAMMLQQSLDKGEHALLEADRERDRLDLMLQILADYQYSFDARDLGTMGVEAALRIAIETSFGRTR